VHAPQPGDFGNPFVKAILYDDPPRTVAVPCPPVWIAIAIAILVPVLVALR